MALQLVEDHFHYLVGMILNHANKSSRIVMQKAQAFYEEISFVTCESRFRMIETDGT